MYLNFSNIFQEDRVDNPNGFYLQFFWGLLLQLYHTFKIYVLCAPFWEKSISTHLVVRYVVVDSCMIVLIYIFFPVFIYSMPGYNCSIKERMLYSSCKNPLTEIIAGLGLEIAKKVSFWSFFNQLYPHCLLLAGDRLRFRTYWKVPLRGNPPNEKSSSP